MEVKHGLLVILTTTICCVNCNVDEVKVNPTPSPHEVTRSPKPPRVIMVTLGGSEETDQLMAMSTNLVSRGFVVTAFVYGGHGAGLDMEGVEIVDIPLAGEDVLYDATSGQPRYIVPGNTGSYDVVSISLPANENQALAHETEPSANQEAAAVAVSTNHVTGQSYDAIVTSSRRLACHQLLNLNKTKDQISRAKIFATPLYLHDLCTLTFARRFDLPVVGLVTSRTGSWWSWYWLECLPSLATTPCPPFLPFANFGFLERLGNLWNFWRYITKVEDDWVKPLMTSEPPDTFQPIGELYSSVISVMVAWDWLTDPDLPMTQYLTSTASLQWDRGHQEIKDNIASSLRLRNGAVLCNLKNMELWVGMAAQHAILRALATTPFTVVWRGVREAWQRPRNGNKTLNNEKKSAIFVYEEDPPIAALLAYPRHRLLISTCGESEVMAAILFGSPTLCIPVTPDQHVTSAKLRDLGLGLVVSAHDVTTNSVKDAITMLTTNRSFRSRGRQVAEEYIDAPISVADRVLHTFEKIVRRPWRYRRRREVYPTSIIARNNIDILAAILVLVTALWGVAIYVVIVFVRVYMSRERRRQREKTD